MDLFKRIQDLSDLYDNNGPRSMDQGSRPMFANGQLVQPNANGSRPGYKGKIGQPKQYDLEKIEEAILKANQGDKYVSYEDIGKKLGFKSPGRISGIVKREGATPLDSYKVKVEKAYIKLFSDFDKNAMELTKPLHRIKEMIGGYKYRKNTNPNRSRVEDISNALKNSKTLNWDEEVKPIINKLSSANFLKNIDKDWTLGDVQNTVQTKSMLRTPKDDAQRLMDYAVRNQTMSKGNTEFSIYNKNNLNKRITDFSQVDSYYDLAFKDGSGKVYDMDYIKTKGRSDPLFQEYFKLQDDLSDMKNRTTWPDGSDIIDPKTGKKTTFGNYSGQMYKFGYGYKKPFSRFPYEIDHNDGVGKNPFKNLSILPQRVNIALGAASRLDKPEIASKIGKDYFRNLPIDDLLTQEKNLGQKILIFNEKGEHVGKNLQTSYTAAKGEINRKANILSSFCNRKGFKLAGSVDGLTCSMGEIQTNMKKQINEAKKVSKDGKIPKKFGKLRAVAGSFFGDIAIPLEYMFMAPDLVAGDIDGALRSSTAGLFGAGKVDLDKLPEGEAKKYIKHTNAVSSFLKNYQSKLMAENSLQNLEVGDEGQSIFADQLAQAEKNMLDITKDYSGFGYTYEPGEKGLLEGKVATQKFIRDKVASDFDKKIDKGASTEFFKDSNKDILKQNIRGLGGDPYEVTPINNLKDYIKNKGEATAGNTNIILNRLPYTLDQAEAYGVGDIFDTYAGGYAGVETPGSMQDGEIDMGTKDVRDAYSSLPIDLASQLAALEKKEFEEGMYKKRLEQGFAGGGIANVAGVDKGPPPQSGPTPQGLRGLLKRAKKI